MPGSALTTRPARSGRAVPRALTTGEKQWPYKHSATGQGLHVLRDNVHRAKRALKLGSPGAAERLKAHQAARLAYAETGK